jgi:hypothetical protein
MPATADELRGALGPDNSGSFSVNGIERSLSCCSTKILATEALKVSLSCYTTTIVLTLRGCKGLLDLANPRRNCKLSPHPLIDDMEDSPERFWLFDDRKTDHRFRLIISHRIRPRLSLRFLPSLPQQFKR